MSDSVGSGRHALVTGGGSGIGLAVARALVASGARVSLVGRTAARLEAAASELGASVAYATADVTDSTAFRAAIADLQVRGGAIDILVNNAGGAESKPFKRLEPDDFRRMFELNALSAATAMGALAPAMIAAGRGRIVNIASTAAVKGYAYVAPYVAAKHALLGLTRAAAVEFAGTGVTVNAVCPGFTDTDLVARSLETIVGKTERSRDDALDALVAANPMKRLIRPEEVADAVVWLCGPDAGAVTGQAIMVAGGEV